MVSSGVGFVFTLLGYTVEPKYVLMYWSTPFAFFLVSMGAVGVLVMANSIKHKRAWLRLFVGFSMIVLAYIYLEALLFQTWSR